MEYKSRLKALDEFILYWDKMGRIERRTTTEFIVSKYTVNYNAFGEDNTIVTVAYINYQTYEIVLDEAEWLNTNKYYIGFNPRWQKYSLKDGHVLRIDGTGEKTGGPYYLTIIPE